MKFSVDEGFQQLAPQLVNHKLIIVAGSGISVPSGLPGWDELLDSLVDFCSDLQGALPVAARFPDILAEARTARKKHPVRVASELKARLLRTQEQHLPNLNTIFRRWLMGRLEFVDPNKNHQHIVKTDYPYILTANYDSLLEAAALEAGFASLYANSFSPYEADQVASAIYEERPSIIHLHGTTLDARLDDFVLTNDDYARLRRKQPGFTVAVQSLFMTHSVLFVGYGGSDPHLEDTIEELSFHLARPGGALPRYFLVLREDKTGHILEQRKDRLRTDLIVVNDYPEATSLLAQLQAVAPRQRGA